MSDPLLRELDHYVVLEPGGEDRILTATETHRWLVAHLGRLEDLPPDLAALPDRDRQADRLLETACELELSPGRVISWYAVRLERGHLG